jgi:hypothetical protein
MSPKLEMPTAEAGLCEEKTRLLDEFLQATHEVAALISQQTRAVIEGDPDFARFDSPLHLAQERKVKSKYAWIEHVESHRCAG